MEFTIALITYTNRHVVAQVTEGNAVFCTVITKDPATHPAVVL